MWGKLSLITLKKCPVGFRKSYWHLFDELLSHKFRMCSWPDLGTIYRVLYLCNSDCTQSLFWETALVYFCFYFSKTLTLAQRLFIVINVLSCQAIKKSNWPLFWRGLSLPKKTPNLGCIMRYFLMFWGSLAFVSGPFTCWPTFDHLLLLHSCRILLQILGWEEWNWKWSVD